MAVNFNHIAYEALEVCNAVSWDAVREAVAAAGLKPGALALDLGAGNATVAIGLARDFGLKVRAVERDPVMAALASRRIAASGQGERVELLVRDSSEVLDHAPLPDLITVLGATDAAAPGLRDPVAVFARLKNAVAPGGRLLWGEPFWKAEPSAPLRQIVEMTNSYQTDAGCVRPPNRPDGASSMSGTAPMRNGAPTSTPWTPPSAPGPPPTPRRRRRRA
ncbi:SAM-dependent methyltransferase [Brevundimonas abyssalis]|uniref:Methyltransferase type 12 n=1 Tax=Brevundimonas abyssalis TAR-001 TaxID=1391729 RepID=A0A8E0KID7_9CAUL|nr:class I SAM-dependent methyltransferase [Brevundimonas abyssalis]GAD58593.1 methyltransferase type 12 [Brevundimonas abyssalis TAR-001]